MTDPTQTFTAFDGHEPIGAGSLAAVAQAIAAATDAGRAGPLLVIDDATGKVVDVDTRGPAAEIAARYATPAEEPRKRGRPKLGVVAREVTLLPRHWEWLAAQPGGASVALRKLVEAARRFSGDRDRTRQAHEAAYRFMTAVAGDLPGFEDAIRALFADDRRVFAERIAAWPEGVRDYAVKLAFADRGEGG